jgi:hypothetical protein
MNFIFSAADEHALGLETFYTREIILDGQLHNFFNHFSNFNRVNRLIIAIISPHQSFHNINIDLKAINSLRKMYTLKDILPNIDRIGHSLIFLIKIFQISQVLTRFIFILLGLIICLFMLL